MSDAPEDPVRDEDSGDVGDSPNAPGDNVRYAVIGYGTFITLRKYEGAERVEPAFVEGFRRVFPPGHWYPFVIPDPTSPGFWGLKFEVTLARLYQLDIYEGVDQGLYYRRKVPARLRAGETIFGYVYVATKRTIRAHHLAPEIDPDDAWRQEIAQHPDIVAQFPELVEEPELP